MQRHHVGTTSPLAQALVVPPVAPLRLPLPSPCRTTTHTSHTRQHTSHHVRCHASTDADMPPPAQPPQPPLPAQSQQQQPMLKQAKNAKALAYLGDAIWALCVRTHFFVPPKHWRSYQAAVQPHVTAEGQAGAYDALLSGQAGASSEELVFLRAVAADAARWRLRRRFTGAAAAAEVYGKATALEALVGYLHLHDPERLQVLVQALLPGGGGSSSGDDSSSSSAAESTGPLDE